MTTKTDNPYKLDRSVGTIMWYNSSTERVEASDATFSEYRNWNDRERETLATVVTTLFTTVTADEARTKMLAYAREHGIEYGYDDDVFRVGANGYASNESVMLPVAVWIEAFIDWYFEGGGYWTPEEVDARIAKYEAKAP